jgi:hypothetical protein
MQVVLQTPAELVVHDGRWTTVLMGAIFSAMGGGVIWLWWTHPTGWSGNAGPWLVYLVGTVFVVVGVVIFWFSADRRYIVDRSARTVRIVVQRLVHQQTTFLVFKDIDDVATVRGDKGDTYKPVVMYNYSYDGMQYQASSVTPISISAGEDWARSIASRYRPGSATTAYVNPDHPNNAYLLRRVSLMPLIFVFIPVLFGLLFSWIVRVQRLQVQLAQKHLVPVVNSV